LLWEDKRVVGVRTEHAGRSSRLYAPLVVGADGRRSTVAYMVASRKYNVNPNERSYYFTFFEGADPAYCDHFIFHRWGDKLVWGGAADSGLFLVGVSPEAHERDYFRSNTERGLLAHMRSCEPMANALADARIATKISGIRNFEGYFRQPTGPGWVLVGDAGHFKDPSAGRGIGDAFLQVEALAPLIIAGLDGRSELDAALQRWGEWRDQRFEGHYYLATVLGKAGQFPVMVPEVLRRMQERGELDRFFDLFHHRTRYDDVFPLRDVGVATGRLLVTGGANRGTLLKQAVTLLAREPRRRFVRRYRPLASTDLTAAPPDRTADRSGARDRSAAVPKADDAAANGAVANGTAHHGSASNGSAEYDPSAVSSLVTEETAAAETR
jgi:2-polyprenyl-6-methoxyphenol hydroxylase-like FAD-dependent oxidoreductase